MRFIVVSLHSKEYYETEYLTFFRYILKNIMRQATLSASCSIIKIVVSAGDITLDALTFEVAIFFYYTSEAHNIHYAYSHFTKKVPIFNFYKLTLITEVRNYIAVRPKSAWKHDWFWLADQKRKCYAPLSRCVYIQLN